MVEVSLNGQSYGRVLPGTVEYELSSVEAASDQDSSDPLSRCISTEVSLGAVYTYAVLIVGALGYVTFMAVTHLAH